MTALSVVIDHCAAGIPLPRAQVDVEVEYVDEQAAASYRFNK
jgi:hypothetical protein